MSLDSSLSIGASNWYSATTQPEKDVARLNRSAKKSSSDNSFTPSLTDSLQKEALHLAAMNFVPFWNTGRYLLGDLKGQKMGTVELLMDVAFFVPILRAGLTTLRLTAKLPILSRVATMAKGAIGQTAVGKAGLSVNKSLGRVESWVAPFRDNAMIYYMGGHGLYYVGKSAITGDWATGGIGTMELGLALIGARSKRYRTRDADTNLAQLIEKRDVHPAVLQRYYHHTVGPLRRPIPKQTNPWEVLRDPNDINFLTGKDPVTEGIRPYLTSARGIGTVGSNARFLFSRVNSGTMTPHQMDRMVQNWSRTYFWTQEGRLITKGFDQHVAPLLDKHAEAVAKLRTAQNRYDDAVFKHSFSSKEVKDLSQAVTNAKKEITPIIFAATHKSCWADFAAVWSRRFVAKIEACLYNFQTAPLVRATGFAKLMRTLDIPFIDRGARGPLTRLRERLTGSSAQRTKTSDNLQSYNGQMTKLLEKGGIPLKFVSDGRLPASFGQKGEIIEAGLFGALPKNGDPTRFLKSGATHLAVYAARELNKPVAIIPLHLDIGAMMAKNHGSLGPLTRKQPFWQKNYTGQTAQAKYGEPIWVNPGDDAATVKAKLKERIIELSEEVPQRMQWFDKEIISNGVFTNEAQRRAARASLPEMPLEGVMAMDRAITLPPTDPRRTRTLDELAVNLLKPTPEARNQGFQRILEEVTEELRA